MVSISGYLVCIYLKVMCSAPTYMNKLPRYLCVSEKNHNLSGKLTFLTSQHSSSAFSLSGSTQKRGGLML